MKIEPTLKQNLFLSSNSDILLFGGAAGGGKSWVLLLDSLGLNDKIPRITLPFYRVLIARKQYSQLSDLIDKSKSIFPMIDSGAIYNSSEMFWKFSSGALLQFTYFENESDVEKIQGKEYTYIGLDELGLWPDDKVMRYCLSRLRSAQNLKCYFRATSNPSRYKWIRETFRIGALGESTKFYVETQLKDKSIVKKSVEYIQAKLSDNPYLGREYESQLMLLPEDQREAFLNGNWLAFDSVEGSVFKKEITQLKLENRLCNIPYQRAYDVFASFDLGRNDTTAIILHQRIGKEIHIIESFENNGEDISYYIDILKKKNFTNCHIILPHDANMHRIEVKNSVYETVKQAFPETTVVPRLGVNEGIDIVKRTFPNIYIDKTNNNRLIECLTSYRRKWNPGLNVFGDVVHDEFSNMADSLRYLCVFEPPKVFKFDFSNVGYTHTI